MDTERAIEIFNSLGVIDVHHKGAPVWIENIEGSTAEVRYLDTRRRARVPVSELVENSPEAQ